MSEAPALPRFSLKYVGDCEPWFEARPDGVWVKFEDAQSHAAQETADLRAALRELVDWHDRGVLSPFADVSARVANALHALRPLMRHCARHRLPTCTMLAKGPPT